MNIKLFLKDRLEKISSKMDKIETELKKKEKGSIKNKKDKK
jgi:hypothetical protein